MSNHDECVLHFLVRTIIKAPDFRVIVRNKSRRYGLLEKLKDTINSFRDRVSLSSHC